MEPFIGPAKLPNALLVDRLHIGANAIHERWINALTRRQFGGLGGAGETSGQ